MSAIVSKPDGTLVVTIRLTLRPDRDDDLIAIIRASPRRGLAATVREAMRSGIRQNGVAAEPMNDSDLSGLGMDL